MRLTFRRWPRAHFFCGDVPAKIAHKDFRSGNGESARTQATDDEALECVQVPRYLLFVLGYVNHQNKHHTANRNSSDAIQHNEANKRRLDNQLQKYSKLI